jgi:ABC-type multidrug transport system ATPase subunit
MHSNESIAHLCTMFQLIGQGLSHRFRREWIFSDMSMAWQANQRIALRGENGSGKSTLLRILSGHLTPTEGQIAWSLDNKNIKDSEVFAYVSLAAPYIELIEEFSVQELIKFQQSFRPWRAGLDPDSVWDSMNLPKRARKLEIKWLSSGMKQRVRLASAILCHSDLLLLDEPGTNLDAAGQNWWHDLLDLHAADRLVVVASNQEDDLRGCTSQWLMSDYK